MTRAAVLRMDGGEFTYWVQYFALKQQRRELEAKMARGGDG